MRTILSSQRIARVALILLLVGSQRAWEGNPPQGDSPANNTGTESTGVKAILANELARVRLPDLSSLPTAHTAYHALSPTNAREDPVERIIQVERKSWWSRNWRYVVPALTAGSGIAYGMHCHRGGRQQ